MDVYEYYFDKKYDKFWDILANVLCYNIDIVYLKITYYIIIS